MVTVITAMIEDDERLRGAGVKRDVPETWRPDLVRPIKPC